MLSFLAIVVEVGIVGEVSRRCNNRQWYIKQEAMQDAMRCKTSGALLSESSVVQAIYVIIGRINTMLGTHQA